MTGYTSYVISVAYNPDGSLIASASWDKTVREGKNDCSSLFTIACNRLQSHSILLGTKVEDVKPAGNGCLRYSNWNDLEKAEFQRNRGLKIAKDGDYQLATKELKQAFNRDNTIERAEKEAIESIAATDLEKYKVYLMVSKFNHVFRDKVQSFEAIKLKTLHFFERKTLEKLI